MDEEKKLGLVPWISYGLKEHCPHCQSIIAVKIELLRYDYDIVENGVGYHYKMSCTKCYSTLREPVCEELQQLEEALSYHISSISRYRVRFET